MRRRVRANLRAVAVVVAVANVHRVSGGRADAFDQLALAAYGERRRSVGRRPRRVRVQALRGFKSHRYRHLPGETPATSCRG
jgi:hypothetical protein